MKLEKRCRSKQLQAQVKYINEALTNTISGRTYWVTSCTHSLTWLSLFRDEYLQRGKQRPFPAGACIQRMLGDSQEGPKSKACLELRLAFGREKGQNKYLLIISNEAFLATSSLTTGKVAYLHEMCEVC